MVRCAALIGLLDGQHFATELNRPVAAAAEKLLLDLQEIHKHVWTAAVSQPLPEHFYQVVAAEATTRWGRQAVAALPPAQELPGPPACFLVGRIGSLAAAWGRARACLQGPSMCQQSSLVQVEQRRGLLSPPLQVDRS